MRPRPLILFGILVVLAAFGLLAGQRPQQVKTGDNFEIAGIALWQCQCPSHACPCQTNGRPKHGTCYEADFAHINKGQYGETRLDGMNIVLVGNLVDTKQERRTAG